MTRTVQFYGQELFEPDTYSRTDVDGLGIPTVEGVGILALIGEADGGQPNVIHRLTNPSSIKRIFRKGDLADACRLGFRAAGLDNDVQGAASEIIAINVKPITQSTKDMGTFTAKSKDYGVHTNLISYEIEEDPNDTEQSIAKIVTSYFEKEEFVSDSLGLKEYIRFEYKGTNATCTAQVNAERTKLTITDSSAHEFLFSQYPTVSELADAVKSVFGADVEVTKPSPFDGFLCVDFDHQVTALNIKTSAKGLRASAYEFGKWCADYAHFTVERKADVAGATIPSATTAKVFLAGATSGVTTNSIIQSAINLLRNVRVNAMVPLITPQNAIGTADADTVFAQTKAYVGEVNSITGRNEAQAYLGDKITKTNITKRASAMNHRAISYVPWACKDIDISGNLKVYPAWASAVVCAALQLGSAIGTSLTYKKLPVTEVIYDTSIKPRDDMKALLLNGYLMAITDDATNVPYIVKGITSVVDSDNNGNTQIEVVESLMQYAYQLRRFLKSRLLGKDKGNPNRPDLGGITERDVKTFIEEFSDFAIDNKVILAYDPKTISVSIRADAVYPKVAVQPREGLNFILIDIEAIRIF